MATYKGKIDDVDVARTVILAGKAEITLVGQETRFTYQVRRSTDKRVYFLRVLTGPDNNTSYKYAGIIRARTLEFASAGKVKISPKAQSVKAFAWVWKWIKTGKLPSNIEFWHSGKCARCGRKLTVPESIGRGIARCVGERYEMKKRMLNVTVTARTCKAGDAVRISGLVSYGDATVLKVTEREVKLARPYVKADQHGAAYTAMEQWGGLHSQVVTLVGVNCLVGPRAVEYD